MILAPSQHLLFQHFDRHLALLLLKLTHRHISKVLTQFRFLTIEQLLQTIADHQGYLVPGKEPILGRTDAFKDGC